MIDDDFVATLKRRDLTVISTPAPVLKTVKRDEQRNDPKQAFFPRAFEIDKISLKTLEGRILPPQMPA